MKLSTILKIRCTPLQRRCWSSRRLELEWLEDRLVPSIPDGTVMICTGPSSFSSQDLSSFPIGIIGVNPTTGAQFPVSINSSQDGTLFTLPTYAIEAPNGQLYVTDLQAFGTGAILRVDPNTGQQFLVTKGQFINGPNVLAWENGQLYVANEADGTGTVHSLVQVDPTTGAQTLITNGSSGGFTVPTGMEPGPNSTVYISDEPGGYSGADPGGVWQVNLSTGNQTLISHDNLIDHPVDLGQDQNGNLLVVNVVSSPGSQPETVIRVNPATPDPTNGTNQSIVYQQQNTGYPPDAVTENLNTGVIYVGAISYGSNPAVLLAISGGTQTVVTSGGQLSEVEGIRVYHPVATTAASNTVVSSSANPQTAGQPVTWTATVTAASGATSPVPTGTVQFTIDGTAFGSPVTLSGSGTASSPSDSTLSAGTHTVTALYSGDSNFAGSAGSLAGGQVVNNQIGSSSTVVTSSANPSAYGQSVTFTASVTVNSPGSIAAASPTGVVIFSDGSTSIGQGTLTTTGGVSTASFSTSSLAVSGHIVRASYVGDSNFTTSNGTTSQTVNKASTGTLASSSASSLVSGQSVTFTTTVTVNAPGSGTPTGAVDFFDTTTATDLGSVRLSSSNASMTVTDLPIGNHTITLSYSGDSNFLASSTSLTVRVNPSVVGNPSVLVLDPTADGALTVSGNATINVTGNVVVNSKSSSALTANGNAVLNAASIQVVGAVKESGHPTLSPAPVTGVAAVADPLGKSRPTKHVRPDQLWSGQDHRQQHGDPPAGDLQ